MDPDYIDAAKVVSREMREQILNYVMVRRTRTKVLKYFNASWGRASWGRGQLGT